MILIRYTLILLNIITVLSLFLYILYIHFYSISYKIISLSNPNETLNNFKYNIVKSNKSEGFNSTNNNTFQLCPMIPKNLGKIYD